jgi:hypothetical protein
MMVATAPHHEEALSEFGQLVLQLTEMGNIEMHIPTTTRTINSPSAVMSSVRADDSHSHIKVK